MHRATMEEEIELQGKKNIFKINLCKVLNFKDYSNFKNLKFKKFVSHCTIISL
jgi:hypothetical protein